MKLTYTTLKHKYEDYYRLVLAFLDYLMERSGLDYILLEYKEYPCMNVYRWNGDTDKVTALLLNKDSEGLTAVGESGTMYPLGRDIDGQDNYILVGIDALLDASKAAVDAHTENLMLCLSNSKENVLDVIRTKLKKNGSDKVTFEGPLRTGKFRGDCTVTAISERFLFYHAGNGGATMMSPLDTLAVTELKHAMECYNDHVRYIYNRNNPYPNENKNES